MPTPCGEVRGTIDAHMHMMAFEFLGGSAHCGRPWHPYGAPYALVDCPDHATGVAPLETALKRQGAPRPGRLADVQGLAGPQVADPRVLLLQVARARLAGRPARLREPARRQRRRCASSIRSSATAATRWTRVRLEAERMRELQDYIDAQNGGPGKGWFRIVKDPFEARRVISEGKLAVVMGIEVSQALRLRRRTTAGRRARRRRSTASSPRSTTWASARWSSSTSSTTRSAASPATSGEHRRRHQQRQPLRDRPFWDMQTCDDEPRGRPPAALDRTATTTDASSPTASTRSCRPGTAPIYPAPPHCNEYGPDRARRAPRQPDDRQRA